MTFKDKIYLLFIIVIVFLASRTLFHTGYFPMHDDLQMMRQLELEKCILDGQIPCRWVPDMGYGFGYPLFNFYPPLPYIFGEVFRVLGFAFTATARMTFILAFLASGITMYFFAREFFGKTGGLISSAFYVWAPYHAVDIYVRGAMNESWALVWFPLILLAGYKLITFKSEESRFSWRWIIILALSWFALLTSHNLMVLIFTPFFAVWSLYWLIKSRNRAVIPILLLAGLWAFGLAAFFSLPALLEQKYVQIQSMFSGYYDFSAHFVSINQMFFSRFWGYGPSVFGTDDGMAFPIGQIHWIISAIAIVFVLMRAVFRKSLDTLTFVVIFAVFIGTAGAFMAHAKSTFIWLAFPQLRMVQFPWRFLTLSVFGFSFAAGGITWMLNELKRHFRLWGKIIFTPYQILLPIFLVITVIIYNWNFFRVERIGPVTDQEKFSGEAWRIQQTAGIYDYLPNTAKMAPQSPRTDPVEVMSGKAEINDYNQGSYWLTFSSKTTEPTTLRINTLYFPDWRIRVNGQDTKVYVEDSEMWGRMYIDLPPGDQRIYAQFMNTWPRTAGNIISLVSWILVAYALFALNRKNKVSYLS